MNEIFKTYLSVSLSASVMILLLMLFRPEYRKRFSRRWQYYIWLAVIARLMIPWNPGSGIIGRVFQQYEAQQSSSIRESGQQISAGEESAALVFAGKDSQDESSQNKTTSEGAAWYQKAQLQDLLQHLWAVWLSAAALLFIRKITIYQSYVRFIRAGCRPVEDIGCLEALGRAVERSRIRCMMGLYTNSLTASPLLTGFFHPSIILTNAQLSDTDFQNILLHELTHYKRRDMFYKWLVQLAVCLHWFNPLVYWMEREISRNCELSCDEAVLKNLDADGRRAYGDTLLRAMEEGGGFRSSLAAVTLNESSELLKERLGAIMNDKKKSGLTAVISAAAALMLACSAAVTGAYMCPAAAETGDGMVHLSDCKMIQEEGRFYILYPGADKQDMPSGGVTDGCVLITLVKKEDYTDIGPFDDMDRLTEDVTELTAYPGLKQNLTQEEAQLLIEAAGKIQENALGVNISRTSVSLKKGKRVTLKLTGTKKQAVWSCDNQNIASVSQNGKVTAKKAGSTKVRAELNGKTFVCRIKVTETAADGEKIKDGSAGGSQNKAEEAAAAEKTYRQLGITEKNGAYFYKGRRIRIFMDIRSDNSFLNFGYDKKGSIDIKLRRKADLSVKGVEYLTEAETEEILKDMEEPDADTDAKEVKLEASIKRLSKKELPDKVLKALGRCKDRTWYVIAYNGYQYLYYHGLPNNYAFQPELSNQKADIEIVDMGRAGTFDVLLAVKQNMTLAVHYRGRKISYQKAVV